MKQPPSYLLASCISFVLLFPQLFIQFQIVTSLVILTLFFAMLLPWILRKNPLLSIRFAAALSTLFALFCIAISVHIGLLLSRAESLSSFEGPNGEGAPIATILAFIIFNLTFLLPWSISSIRTIQNLKNFKQPCQKTSSL